MCYLRRQNGFLSGAAERRQRIAIAGELRRAINGADIASLSNNRDRLNDENDSRFTHIPSNAPRTAAHARRDRLHDHEAVQ